MHAAEDFFVQRNVRGAGQMARRGSAAWLNSRSRSLSGCSGTGTMQSHARPPQHRRGLAHEQVGEKIFKPQRPRIFEPVDGLQHHAFGHDRRAGGTEMQFQFVAIGANEAWWSSRLRNGRPQRSQNGGRMKRTCDQHWRQTKPSRAVGAVFAGKAGRRADTTGSDTP